MGSPMAVPWSVWVLLDLLASGRVLQAAAGKEGPLDSLDRLDPSRVMRQCAMHVRNHLMRFQVVGDHHVDVEPLKHVFQYVFTTYAVKLGSAIFGAIFVL